MTRLGLRLTLKGGRESLVRLAVTVVAVAVGVTVLLGVFADFHAFQATSGRACWECTSPAPASAPRSGSVLWNYGETIYDGRFIEVLDAAPLGTHAPVLPGLARWPGPGSYDASPALAALVREVPAAQLGDRFAGQVAGVIGHQALSGPNELVAVVGYQPAKLAALPGTITVDHIYSRPQTQGTTNLYRMAFGIGTIIVLFPLLVLVSTATRLSAARREERFAAMRLVGGTPGQVNALAAVEAAVGGLLGAVLGCVCFRAAQLALASISLSGQRFFSTTVTPTILGYGVVVVGVPVASALAAFWALRRVRVTPLGVSRKVTPAAPRAWRLVPLIVGVPLFAVTVSAHPSTADLGGTYGGLLLIMVGLIAAGSWLTMQAARLMAHVARGAASVLASRRLADNPKAAFRTVSGLVLAVFIGSLVATLGPAFSAAQSRLGGANSLTSVLRDPYQGGALNGLSPELTSRLMTELKTFNPAVPVPIYNNPSFQPNFIGGSPPPPPPPTAGPSAASAPTSRSHSVPSTTRTTGSGDHSQYDSVVNCTQLAQVPALGHCRPGAKYVYANLSNMLLTDNPLEIAVNLPAVTNVNPVFRGGVSSLLLGTLLVKTTNDPQLETVRTFLTSFNRTVPADAGVNLGDDELTAWQMGDLEPETFGEVAKVRNNDVTNIENVVFSLVVLTLLVAACSLAVTVCGGIMERKRPFTLLKVTGTTAGTLRAVVLLEAALPLVSASLLAALTGVGLAIPLVRSIPRIKEQAAAALPGTSYYLAMGVGLLVALMVVSAALPLLSRVTRTEDARFE